MYHQPGTPLHACKDGGITGRGWLCGTLHQLIEVLTAVGGTSVLRYLATVMLNLFAGGEGLIEGLGFL